MISCCDMKKMNNDLDIKDIIYLYCVNVKYIFFFFLN